MGGWKLYFVEIWMECFFTDVPWLLDTAAAGRGPSLSKEDKSTAVQYGTVDNAAAAGLGGSLSKENQGTSVQCGSVDSKVARSTVWSSTLLSWMKAVLSAVEFAKTRMNVILGGVGSGRTMGFRAFFSGRTHLAVDAQCTISRVSCVISTSNALEMLLLLYLSKS